VFGRWKKNKVFLVFMSFFDVHTARLSDQALTFIEYTKQCILVTSGRVHSRLFELRPNPLNLFFCGFTRGGPVILVLTSALPATELGVVLTLLSTDTYVTLTR
jgi:hypothetical protein